MKNRYGQDISSAGPSLIMTWIRWMLIGIGFFVLLGLTFFIVPAGNVAVVTRFGAVNRVAYPGIGVRIPIAEGYVLMDVRTQIDPVDASSASKDLQTVTAKIAVNYHLDGAYAVDVYQNIGADYRNIVIAPAIQNTFKATTAQYTAEQLITNREAVRVAAEQALTEQLAVYHVVVENFNIVNFDFSPDFNAAIEAKQVAQQQVETAKQQLAKAQVDAQSVAAAAKGQADAQVIQAQAEAQSIQLRGQALQQYPNVIQYEFVQKLSGVSWGILPQGSVLPFLQLPAVQTPSQ